MGALTASGLSVLALFCAQAARRVGVAVDTYAAEADIYSSGVLHINSLPAYSMHMAQVRVLDKRQPGGAANGASVPRRRGRPRLPDDQLAPSSLRARRLRERRRTATVDADPAGAVAAWSAATLKVPPGHPLAGEPMKLPDYAVDWLRDALAPGIREALLCVARKNAKSAIVAVLVLAYLVGPLYRRGWRAAVVSVNAPKAAELTRQAEEIARASGLEIGTRSTQGKLYFRRQPGLGIEVEGASCQVLASDRTAGHASGFDLVIVDELGLLHERDRPLLSGLRSSTSARDGRVLAITIKGDGPFIPEMIARAADPSVVVKVYEPPEGADPLLPATWEHGNPTLGTIKSRQYMVDRARLVAHVPADLALFSAEDCNLAGAVTREMICTVADWNALLSGQHPERTGECVVGLDLGGSDSLTAAAVCWPESGRLEVYAAVAVSEGRSLADRGRDDGVGDRYEQLAADGRELWTYGGRRVTPVGEFIVELAAELRGQRVASCGADRYRRAEALDAMADADCRWPMVWRGQGASATADGSADVRSFERAVRGAWLRPVRGARLMLSAISESVIVRDKLGNPAIERARRRGRIDPLSAAVIATGLAERIRARPSTGYRSFVIGEVA